MTKYELYLNLAEDLTRTINTTFNKGTGRKASYISAEVLNQGQN